VESADVAVIPFENSLGGGVGEAIDILREKDLQVTGEVLVKIDHVLASKNSIEEIEKVRSHPQALTQCREMIQENGWEEVESSSTAKAAEEIKENEAAICSRLAAELNDLEILEESVQDEDSNTTRFLVIGGEKEKETEKTSFVLEPGEDRPGLLGSMLSCFSGHGINLSYIQSRPTRDGLGQYYFYVEAEESEDSEKMGDAVDCLETYAEIKNLGSYRKGEKNV
jgi:prephenate dehydratase